MYESPKRWDPYFLGLLYTSEGGGGSSVLGVPLRAGLNLEGAADAGRLRRRAPPAGYGGLLL